MTNPIELILLNRPSEIARLQDQLESFAQQHSLPPKALHEVQLAVEEHLSNVLKYAFTDQGEHRIKVRLRAGPTELCIEVEDDGRPFNLLEHPAPDLSLPLEQRPIGGLGIHMIRKSMDQIEYRRAGGKNILVMVKQVKAPAP
jgi:anti-sigma regulatory factor (Ser/Thr protein kinase)